MDGKVRRWATQDLVLVAICVATITIGVWPIDHPRQMIHCLGSHGNTTSYSLSVNDSRLARIRRELGRLKSPKPTAKIILAKWRIDLATHYAQRCSPQKSPESDESVRIVRPPAVIQVSLNQTSDGPVARGDVIASEYLFWRSVLSRSQDLLASEQQKIATQLAQADAPSIVLGEIVAPPRSCEAWITAVLLGILAACLYADWAYRVSAIEFSSHSEKQSTSDELGLRLQIPKQWIRVHQPTSVWVRRATLLGLVLGALGAVWRI